MVYNNNIIVGFFYNQKEYINLIDKLSDLDKERINNYIDSYGVPIKTFIGLDEWLQNWSHSNQRLYKLLGNQFIKEFNYEFEKNSDLLALEMKNLLLFDFKKSYHRFYWDYLKELDIDNDTMEGFSRITNLKEGNLSRSIF